MKKDNTPKKRPPRHMTEEDVLLEVSGDRRLDRLGIDPDADPMEILEEIERRQEERKAQEEAARRAKADKEPGAA